MPTGWPGRVSGTLQIIAIKLLIFLCSLATNTTYVQQRLAEYANDLISLGVDGLRLDAAKREHYDFGHVTGD